MMKRLGKHNREKKVLLGLIDLHIEKGQPVGSHTLHETAFPDLSSATIRNYCAHLEQDGYLHQPHTSGGRVPTAKGYRFYAQEILTQEKENSSKWKNLQSFEGREIPRFLQDAAEQLSQKTQCAVFLSAPRFDHDFITSLKLVPIDPMRCLVVLVTDFGVIQSELLPTTKKINTFSTKRMESYFHWRLTGTLPPEPLEKEEEQTAQAIFNEMLTRYIVGYSHFTEEELFSTGLSRLLNHTEFHDPTLFANTLSLFENPKSMRLLLREAMAKNEPCLWIGEDLAFYTPHHLESAILAAPYSIHRHVAGAVGLLGPMRLPYQELIPLLKGFGTAISQALTRNVYKFKISYRQPTKEDTYLHKEEHQLLGRSRFMLIEQKSSLQKQEKAE